LTEATEKIQRGIEEYTREGTGWAVDRVVELFINFAKYQPFRGGSYIDLPAAIESRKAVINIKNNDDYCLRWSIHASRHPADKNPQRPSKYRNYWDTLDFSGVESPTPLTKIKQVEGQNHMAINVLGYDKGVYPLHISSASENIPRTNLYLDSSKEKVLNACYKKHTVLLKMNTLGNMNGVARFYTAMGVTIQEG
jgi:hypothetical protein